MLKHNLFFRLSLCDKTYFSIDAEVYSGLSQISKMEIFANIRNGLKPLATFLNRSVSDVWVGSEYVSVVCFCRVIFYKID